LHNCLDNSVCFTQNVIIPEAQYAKAFRNEPFVAHRVFAGLLCMLSTIDLDDQSCFQANKIRDVYTKRKLPTKLISIDLLSP